MGIRIKQLLLISGLLAALLGLARAQDDKPAPPATPPAAAPENDMSDMDMSSMNHDNADPDSGAAHAMNSMQAHHMDMGAHMKMSHVRELASGDEEKADAVLAAARAASAKYADYKVALNDGYRIFLRKLPQKMYHFTNYAYAFEAAFHFNPEHPTSLLYEKHGDDYKLVGVMYTAPKRAGENELDKRIPLSIAQWHAHVNLCRPPKDHTREDVFGPNARFGLAGSISTKEQCQAADGRWMPQVFGWMVHVYPFEKTPEEIWAVDRGHAHQRME
jgi:hypothetical protein